MLALMRFAIILLAVVSFSPFISAADWLTYPSRYSHDSKTGSRITQYTPIEAPSVPQPANFRTSGYTHTRSSLNYGQSADNYHRVEQWGDPVRPYGEWRFPYRPYSTPYPNWGPPYAGLNLGGGFYGPPAYDPYRGAGLSGGGGYPGGGGGYPGGGGYSGGGGYPAQSGVYAASDALPSAAPGDGLLPPTATMSAVPRRDGVGIPVDGTIPEGELMFPRSGPGEGEMTPGNGMPSGSAGSGGRPNTGRGHRAGTAAGRDRYRPIMPQPSPFNPYPSGPRTPYPVAPYYDGYNPVYRN